MLVPVEPEEVVVVEDEEHGTVAVAWLEPQPERALTRAIAETGVRTGVINDLNFIKTLLIKQTLWGTRTLRALMPWL